MEAFWGRQGPEHRPTGTPTTPFPRPDPRGGKGLGESTSTGCGGTQGSELARSPPQHRRLSEGGHSPCPARGGTAANGHGLPGSDRLRPGGPLGSLSGQLDMAVRSETSKQLFRVSGFHLRFGD